MTEKKTADELLREWRNICFFDTQLTMEEAADSLSNDGQPLVQARPGTGKRASTWTLYDVNTNEEAILVHAGIWSSNTDLHTGNFVPVGEKAPSTVSESRIQNAVGFKCDVSYTIDTGIDDSLWNHLETFETYIQTMDGFNRTQRERARWQDGSRRDVYIISSKLFVRGSTRPKEPDFEPHDWLKKGLAAQKWKEFAINPDRPLYYDFVDNTAIKLENANPPYFQRGDIIWFAFKVSFFVGNQNWSPEIIPLEFMRVASSEGLYTILPDEEEGSPPQDGKDTQEVTAPTRLEEGKVLVPISRGQQKDSEGNPLKRKNGDGSDVDTLDSTQDSAGGTTADMAEADSMMEATSPEEKKTDVVAKKKSKKARA